MAFIVRTINGDTVDESTFEDCKYAIEVFKLLTVLRYRVKDLYEESDVVLYYNNVSKLIKGDNDLKHIPSEEIKDATLVIHFKARVPMTYVTTFQTNTMDDNVPVKTRNVTPEYIDHSVQVPMVVIDNIRQQVVNMEESLRKIEEQQIKDEETHIASELSQLLDDKNESDKGREKLAEIAHGYYFYKVHLAEKVGDKPIMNYGKCLKNILSGADELCADKCKGATVTVGRYNHILNITLKSHQGHFPNNQELLILDVITNRTIGTVDLTGLFPYEGAIKRLKIFPVDATDYETLHIRVRNKQTKENLLIGQGPMDTKIYLHPESESVYTPPFTRATDDNDGFDNVDLHGLQSETTKLYQEILKFENANDAGKSIISEEDESVLNSKNWEEYDFLSDSSV